MNAHFVLLKTKLLTCSFITLHLLSFHFHLTVTATYLAKLADEEMEALKIIGAKLGKNNWDFSVDPCSKQGNWFVKGLTRSYESSVTCDCSYKNYTVCHIVRIALKSQNISGFIPPEFSRLQYLAKLDLSRNVFTGCIPSEWATMRLTDLSLMTNNLSGPFPMVITKIRTLVNLSLGDNSFSGPIPSEIGILNLESLHLMSNLFSGELPAGLANLTNLNDLRLSDNNFSGKIPDFIGNWKKIQILQIQGTSLNGPLPLSISALTNLTDLRISDLKGDPSQFPDLRQTFPIKTLILRNCLLYGTLPEYIGKMRGIRLLDLSYNNLTGVVPSSFEKSLTDYLYLTGNNLSGTLPRWLLERSKSTDVSVNNFTWEGWNGCIQGAKVNLAESFSRQQGISVHSCYEKYMQCSSTKNYGSSLHINCGGDQVTINGTTYQADNVPRGAASFYPMPNWALSSTGNFMDIGSADSVYIINSTSTISIVSKPLDKLYTSARDSPLSVTYYALCLLNGPYFAKLHFAELIFSNDNTFASLGRRIFDVYIQDELVLKDFNIVKEAGGSNKPVVKSFPVNVTDHTLKIHLYWAGKGTTGVPVKGVYGPLISAIDIDPNFIPPSQKGENKNIYVVPGSVFVALVFILTFICCVLRRKGYLRGKLPKEQELISRDLLTGLFTLPQLKAATNNFDSSNKLGEGGFGAVYKGKLSDGTLIAVKQLSTKSKQGSREFITEIGMISSLQHPNLVRLYGCCAERDQLLLIYEYMENNCLSRALFGRDKALKLKLDWPTRQKICLGIARGLRYLHEESIVKIVHRDIKTSNVLLDKELNAKISDFGLAKLNEEDNVQVSTRVAGTVGYMAPEYAMRGHLSSKADVYSFGVVALEIVSGKSNTDYIPAQEFVYLLDWANVLQEKGNLLELVDPDLGSDYCSEDALVMLKVALLCTNASPSLRPTMSQVISILEGETDIQDHVSDNPSSKNDINFRSTGTHFWEGESQVISGSAMSITTDISSVAYDRDDIHKPLKFYSAPD